jgi:hypothetical protein
MKITSYKESKGFILPEPIVIKERMAKVKPKEEKEEKKEKAEEEPSLSEQMQIIKRWWILIDEGEGNFEIPVDQISDFLVRKGVAENWDAAKRIIKRANPSLKSSSLISYEQFCAIFCKGIFKEALISLQELMDRNGGSNSIKEDIQEMDNSNVLSLPVQINQY